MDELKKILVLVEDKNFYRHHGIDFLAVCRAIAVNIREKRYAQGGSTITQQLARTLYLYTKKTLFRKVKEAFIAFYLELTMTKEQILDKYMETVYLGVDKHGKAIKGFEKASKYYFKKDLKDTNTAEKVVLVGMLKGPGIYKPGSRSSDIRKISILSEMLSKKMITLLEFYEYVFK